MALLLFQAIPVTFCGEGVVRNTCSGHSGYDTLFDDSYSP
jgi:hypothetical protein